MDINIRDDGSIYIKGTINTPFDSAKLIAANPIDRMSNYSGSALPFPCADIAFENTPNEKKISTPSYDAVFSYPNSYYMPNGIDKIPPTIYLVVDGEIVESKVLPERDITMLRTLTYRQSASRERFHAYRHGALPIATQEHIMYAYKNMKIQENIA